MRVVVTTPLDFSFRETVSAHGWRRLLPFSWDENSQALEHIQEYPSGKIALIRMSDQGNCILVEAHGTACEAEVIESVRRILQMDLPLHEFHGYCRTRPELAPIADARQGRMLRCPTLFEDVIKVIATANTTWTQTIAMTSRLVEHFGAPLPQDTSRRAFPIAKRIASVPREEFDIKARMGYRNAYVHGIATSIASGELDLEAWQTEHLTPDELRKRLLTLPGIGPYGAACLMLYLGKPEHVNVDSWARTLLAKELGKPVNDKEVTAFFASHGPWRGLVYNFYPWAADNTSAHIKSTVV